MVKGAEAVCAGIARLAVLILVHRRALRVQHVGTDCQRIGAHRSLCGEDDLEPGVVRAGHGADAADGTVPLGPLRVTRPR